MLMNELLQWWILSGLMVLDMMVFQKINLLYFGKVGWMVFQKMKPWMNLLYFGKVGWRVVFLLLLLLGMILEGVEVVMRMVSLVLLLTVGLIGLFGMTHHFEFESIFVKEVV